MAVHAEGPAGAVQTVLDYLARGPRGASVRELDVSEVRAEGHEQFAIRGVAAGVFVVQEHSASTHHFDLRLEVDGAMRSWAVPKGPSMDPAVKRLAVQVEDHQLSHNDFEGATGEKGGVIVWDRGPYEQGGRVPWPEALERGHAVFVLHGEKLRRGLRAPAHGAWSEAPVAAAQAPRRAGTARIGCRRRGSPLGAERTDARGGRLPAALIGFQPVTRGGGGREAAALILPAAQRSVNDSTACASAGSTARQSGRSAAAIRTLSARCPRTMQAISR